VVAIRIGDCASGAGRKTCAAFRAEIGIDIESFFDFAGNGLFGAFFGAGAAPDAVFIDAV
jgi:hypothetical protein